MYETMSALAPKIWLFALLLALDPCAIVASESSVFEKVSRKKATDAALAEKPPAAQPAKAVLPEVPPTPKLNPVRIQSSDAKSLPPVEGHEQVEIVEGDAEPVLPRSSRVLDDSPYLGSETEAETIVEQPFTIEDVPPHDLGDTCEYDHRPLLGPVCNLCNYLRRPMQGQSWLSRPMNVGVQAGGIWGGELIAGEVTQSSGKLLLFNIGWDRSNCDGYEIRFGGSTIDTFNEHPPLDPRNTRFGLFDFSALLYPWGDSRLRPFARLGVGLHNYKFVNHEGREIDNVVPAAVLGVGAKYLFTRHCAMRMEFMDNIGWGDGLDLETIHNTALTFGIEFRFGGARKNYWPWNSGRLIW